MQLYSQVHKYSNTDSFYTFVSVIHNTGFEMNQYRYDLSHSVLIQGDYCFQELHRFLHKVLHCQWLKSVLDNSLTSSFMANCGLLPNYSMRNLED